MGLTLNNNSLTLASSGGSTASGLTTSDVNTLIQAQSEYEYITTVSQDTNVSEWLITTGIDHTKYSRHKYVITHGQLWANGYWSWHLLQPDGSTRWNNGGSWYSRRGTGSSSQSNINSSSILYFDGQPRTGSWSFNAEIEVIDEKTQNSGSGDHCINVFTRTGMGRTGGYWNGFSLGHAFFKKPDANTFHGGISIRQDVKELTCHIFGMRRRT